MADKDEWGTPKDIFYELDSEFHFTFDPCGCKDRFLKPDMLTLDKDYMYYDGGVLGHYGNGLMWSWWGMVAFVNPPYSGNNIEKWIKKCHDEKDRAKVIVLLIPTTKTGTEYFHKYVIPFAEIRFVKGRINFVPLAGQNDNSNPLYSLICIFRREED